jgi:hypothetical protein
VVKGLLYEYSPALCADKERIEAESYDSEIVQAFMEVLKLAFPFGSAVGKLTAAMTVGRKGMQT